MNAPMSDLPQPEKVRILLAEHSALRAEFVARTGHGYQMVAVGATGLAISSALFQHTINMLAFWAILAIFVLVLGGAIWFILRDIRNFAERLREIEIDINDRAGEDLLVWQNLWAFPVTGYWGRAQPLPRSKLSELPRPERTFRGKRLDE
jgi:hypothetical protein